MDRHRLIWGGLGLIGLVLSAWVIYLFVAAPLPARLQMDWSSEAKVNLARLCELEKTYFTQHGHYTDSLVLIDYYQEETDGGKYWLQVDVVDSLDFLAHAYARQDFDGDGEQSVWEVRKDCVPKELSKD